MGPNLILCLFEPKETRRQGALWGHGGKIKFLSLPRTSCAGDLPRTLSQEAPGKLEVLPGRGGWARQDGKAKQSRETGTDARKASPRTSRCLSVNWEGFSVFKVLLESLGLMSLSKPQEAVKDREAGALQSMGVTKNRTRLSA